MLLRELFVNPKRLIIEGGNLSVDGHQAQHIDLHTIPRGQIVTELNKLLHSINSAYHAHHKNNLFPASVLQSQKFLSGSSLHLFNTSIPDEEFVKHKPKVGDIDTQVDKKLEGSLENFLKAKQGHQIGPATLLGYSRGNEQFSSLWEFQNPPIKVQVDLEFVEYANDEPTEWAQFSHSSDWGDLTQGIKGVFHKYMMRALTSGSSSQKYVARQLKKGVKIATEPVVDKDVSFAVSSKQGGGMRQKYQPYMDPETGEPMVKDGIPVMLEIPTSESHYIQDLNQQFQMLFHTPPVDQDQKLMWSFQGLIQLANRYLSDDARQQAADDFTTNLYGPAAQGLYKGDPKRDQQEKGIAFHTLLGSLKLPDIAAIQNKAHAEADAYYKKYKTNQNINESEVKAQLRKGMPHLHDLKAPDFLDLIDELHDGNGRFKLQNIPLNVKVDGFGGRFGKNAEGKPFMGTSRTEPRYQAGFVDYHQKKGTTDPDILGRARLFDDLFHEMMNAVELVDSKLGPDFLVNKQITCEVLYLPFATETAEGRLKFVGIHYDKLPQGVQLALVPFRVVDATTGEDLPDSHAYIKQLLSVGNAGSVMFINNSLTQKQGLDVTEIINPLENIEELKQIVGSTLGKRDKISLQIKRELEEKLQPIKVELEKAIINDPNIIGKDMLGKDYEGIVINSRLGPIKVTSQEQRDVITAKLAAKKSAWQEQPRANSNKTAVVAIGSFVGHKGHQELWNFTVNKAKEVGGDPYLFIGNAEGKDDPIPPSIKVQTWHKLYPHYAKNISTVTHDGGTLIQKIKHELINPLPGKPPRYDNIIIMVGEDRANMNIAQALMKAVNKFQGYEHVKAHLEVTPRGQGVSGTQLRKMAKLSAEGHTEQAINFWRDAFNSGSFGASPLPDAWLHHLMNVTQKGMGLTTEPKKVPTPQEQPKSEPLNIKEANRIIREMRARDFIKEGTTPMHPHHVAAGLGTHIARDVGGYDRVYHMNRMMMAMGMADGKSTNKVDNVAVDTWFEKYNTIHPMTQEEDNKIRAAMKTIPTDGKTINKFSKSVEAEGGNVKSIVAKPKKNKYGI